MWQLLLGLFASSILGVAYSWWWYNVGRWRKTLTSLLQQGLIIGEILDVYVPGVGWITLSRNNSQDHSTYSYNSDGRLVSIMQGLVGKTLGWNPNILLNPHMLIVGTSGWGKTSLLRRIVKSIWTNGFSRLKLMVFDYLGHFTDLGLPVIDLAETPIEPLSLIASREVNFNSGSPGRRARAFTEAFSVATGLGPLQLGILLRTTIQAFKQKGVIENMKSTWKRQPPSIQEIIDSLYKTLKTRRLEEATKLEARLHEIQLTYTSTTDIISLKTIYRVMREHKGIVLDMHALDIHTRIFFTDLIVRRLLDYTQTTKTIQNTIIVVDEAKYAGFLDKRTTETRPSIEAALIARNYGIGIILSSQGIAHFPSDVLRNTAFKIIGTLTHAQDKEYIAKTISPEVAHTVENLPRAHSITQIQAAKNLVPPIRNTSRIILLTKHTKIN